MRAEILYCTEQMDILNEEYNEENRPVLAWYDRWELDHF